MVSNMMKFGAQMELRLRERLAKSDDFREVYCVGKLLKICGKLFYSDAIW